MNSTTGIIILAAGASSRMGQSKQLLSIKGKSLIVQAAETALASGVSDVVMVLGANADAHRNEIKNYSVHIIINDHWAWGMGTSIKAGLAHLISIRPQTDSALIMLVDQPKVTASHLQTLIKCLKDFTKSIVCSFYANTPGVPVVFSKTHFNEILSMDDDAGARKIIMRYPDQVLTIGFPEGSIDLDTPDDFEKFLKSQ